MHHMINPWKFIDCSFPIVRLACAPIVETRFLELAMSLLDFSPRKPLVTFSILLNNTGTMKRLCPAARTITFCSKELRPSASCGVIHNATSVNWRYYEEESFVVHNAGYEECFA